MYGQMNVQLLAHTQVARDAWWLAGIMAPSGPNDETADYIAEFAGRACYKSFHRPNPATASNVDYLANILGQEHYSVLEHSSATFYVEHVSRALLLELERHRFLSFSVESQRYVDQQKSHPYAVIPPAIRGNEEATRALQGHYEQAMVRYEAECDALLERGLPKKQAREAARSYLPNATPTDFVVTGNLRCWRDVLGKRLSPAADAEIREFAQAVLGHLRKIAPNCVQDLADA